MKVFYSWQLDSPRKVNKDLILAALTGAAAEVNAELDVSEAEREGKAIEVDHDTKDVLGSPPITEVIFEKIKSSDLVLADVTLVAKGKGTKLHINSNVAIELGYALGHLGYGAILKVMNVSNGGRDKLPFDLRGRRGPVAYDLADGAANSEIRSTKDALQKKLVGVLRDYVAASASRPPNRNTLHEEEKSTHVESAFWQRGQPIAKDVSLRRDLFCDAERLIAVRVIPKDAQERLDRRSCLDALDGHGPYRQGQQVS